MQAYEEIDYSKKVDLGIWKRLLKYARPYYGMLAGVALCMLVTAATDVLLPLLTREAIDGFIARGVTEGIGAFMLKYALVIVMQTLSIAGFCFFAGRVEVGMVHRIRDIAFVHLQELPFSFYDRTPIGYLIARMTSDAQRLGDTIGWGLLDLVWGSSYILITVGVMLAVDWALAIAVLVVLPLIALVTAFFQHRILASFRAVRKVNAQITGAFNEGIMGAKTTKTLTREAQNYKEFSELTGRMKSASVRAAWLSGLFLPIVMSISSMAAAWVLWRGGYKVADGHLTFGTLTLFMTLSTQIFDPINNLARVFADLQSSQSAAERVMALIETPSDIVDSPEVVERYGDSFAPRKENWPEMKGAIEFEDVSFGYKGGEEVLEHFNLSVAPGQTIALVGETGSGKSTIVNLLCRFYEPTGGHILIDGVDYKARSQLWLMSHLGYVLQEPHLFSGTVRDNIRYGRLDATDREVEQAAVQVAAHPFIEALEKGYDTEVGEGGGRLSTGQKQLISFARALIANPRLFVLDEATSSVDTETERAIQQAIGTVLNGRTSFIIAHRLSTIRTADRILVIEDGRVIEQGTHRELLARKGHYYRLYANQFREEAVKGVMG